MIWNAFLLALREIRRSAMRSMLTTLGIVIGIASVITMVMIGDATTAYVTQSITKLGTNMLVIRPGQDRHGPPVPDASTKPFKYNDVEAIKREIPDIRAISPANTQNMQIVFGNQNYSSSIVGTDNDFFIVKDWKVSLGRVFSAAELQSGKAVCILGETPKNELFGAQDPIGNTIRMDTISCQVIGVLEPKGVSMLGMDQDDVVIVPFAMFQRRISGNQDISIIMLSADSADAIESVKSAARALLQERRHIGANDKDNFNIRDLREILQTLSSTTKMLTLLLGAIAAISLLVGGIGIMNIMLVSVTERTREIGIRLAIGALEREVLLQFLVEAVVLSSLGGVIGIVLGIGAGITVSLYFELPIIMNFPMILIAFSFSTAVGILFGYFPARKAARLNPIDALRYE